MDEVAPAPLAGLTGRNVTVAVIDSGVHPAHDHIAADRLGPGVIVLPDGAVVEGEDVWLDRLGHGTAVTAAIQEKATGALCFRSGCFATP
jgi:subtilisin family serine protease